MGTQLIAGDNFVGVGGDVILSGGVGVTDGNVIIEKRTDDSICELVFNGSGTSSVSLQAGIFTGTVQNIKFILPVNVGEVGQVLKTDGNNPSQLSWESIMAGTLALDDLSDVIITPPLNDKQVLRYDGTDWRNLLINLSDVLEDVMITNPSNGDVLRYNGSEWVNEPANVPERITAPGGGSPVSPTTEVQGTTYIATTGTGDASGVLLDGAYDGMLKRFVAADLNFDGTNYTNYVLDTSSNTTLIDANGQIASEIEFVTTGNSVTLVWDAVNVRWYIEGAGARINP